MFKKLLPFILIILLGATLFAVRKWKGTDTKEIKTTTRTTDAAVNRDRGFDRRISYLKYSEHARCRMQCRHITQAEVEEIMKDGSINYRKSELQNARCPRYAVEGTTKDNQKVRIVFAQCNESTTVVTVIDLDTEWTCHCPGDDKKYENQN